MPDISSLLSEHRYEIVRQIHEEGGMGIVYEARQLGCRGFVKRVAIKVVRDRYVQTRSSSRTSSAKPSSWPTSFTPTSYRPIISGIGWIIFIAMELIRGVNLEQFLKKLGDTGTVLPGNWRFLSSAGSHVDWPTRTRKTDAGRSSPGHRSS